MVCVYCGKKTKTTNSRSSRGYATWRRKNCNFCNGIFTTYESADLAATHRVLKKSGVIEPFYETKITLSILQAINHRKHSIADAAELTRTVKSKLLPSSPLIGSNEIARVVIMVLRSFDASGAVRYQAFQEPLVNKRDVRRALRN